MNQSIFSCTGVSVISHRLATANNSLTEDGFDPKEDPSYIVYYDANNLYGYAMQQPLPVGKFEWVDESEFGSLLNNIRNIPVDNPVGYVLEVDLLYPAKLHDRHNDYPLAPEKMTITSDMMSPYCQAFFTDKPYRPEEKLVPNLMDKSKYVLHYRNLQLYLALGLEVKKVHRVLSFAQKPWLADYIELNTRMRQRATSDFEKDFFKLANNSVYGYY